MSSRNATKAGLITLYCCIALLVLSNPQSVSARQMRISVQSSRTLLTNPVAKAAIDDCINLLHSAFPGAEVALNAPAGSVNILLPVIAPGSDTCLPSVNKRPYRCSPVPDPSYRWSSQKRNSVITLRLKAKTAEGVASGLYGLLQEKLGFRFHHPRETITPTLRSWPLAGRFTFSGQPLFEKRGFHLHTLHPMELTEQLHNPGYPGAFVDIAAYLDWLARNGQNSFQFFLLRGIDRTTWPTHARRIVEYAHRRGIRCGVEISLAMIQQQAFQVLTLLQPYPSYRHQVDDSLAWLFQVPWDFISLEATLGEHLPFLDKLLPEVQTHLEQQVEQRYGARLLYATHVICPSDGEKVRRPRLSTSGIMIHTVMCYSASEAHAPVYGNVNQRFMLEAAGEENSRRETWYWPESSYWVGFDTSVPLLLFPYLDARWSDISTMARIGVSGHLTFSSGWEWGYWLVDWSIARWSWRYADNGRQRPSSPLSRLNELLPDPQMKRLWKEALVLQNHYLKDKGLMRYLAALTPFSELPRPFNKAFQPEPEFSYAWLLHDAGQLQADAVLRGPVMGLEAFGSRMVELVRRLDTRIENLRQQGRIHGISIRLAAELGRGLRVTALRAQHRALTLRALLAKRREHADVISHVTASETLLKKARLLRYEALQLVLQQEGIYRYPPAQIARKRPSLTAYPFGYLYPASNLFFWEREEEQVRSGRFDALFMNLWDLRRTLGLESLLFKQ